MKPDWSKLGIFFAIATVVVVIDQITKAYVRAVMPIGASWPEDWLVRFTHVTNTGAAFGMFQNQSLMFVFIAVFAIGLIVYYYQRLPTDAWLVRIALGMQLGGAIGNLIDRLHQGYVTDFIEFPNFPVFNIADSSISIGVAILAYYLLFVNREESKAEQSKASETAPS